MSGRKNVVIVGGGGFGAALARSLSQKLDPTQHTLTLINSRSYIIWYPATIRMTTTAEQELEKSCLVPYDKLLVNGLGTIKIARVIRVDARTEGKGGSVALDTGESIDYDVLLLAPGSVWPEPLDFPDGEKRAAVNHIQDWRKKFKDAQDIVVVGGGSCGIEYAGEVADFYPGKKVTIVHGPDKLLNSTYPDKFRKRIEQDVRETGVNIVFGDYMDDNTITNGFVTTRLGKKIKADLVVSILIRPDTESNTTLLFRSLLVSWNATSGDVLDAQGYIRIKSTFQLLSYPDVLSCGDACDWKEEKQVAKAMFQEPIIVANILALLAGHAPPKQYKGTMEMIIVTNGRYRGVSYFNVLWGILLGNWFTSWMKSKELVVSQARRNYGL
ncbi:FAD/NAD(P)-binding domain-containing protein [Auriscalpium vulgare]|uniref:FAD/NAD(P)-binding domain-containing protein n=1 Tax=Auriscalpium vulgare TaxID=40419 RepID=A0ACB8RDW4_9AGAM|nr:FAD/NAD(P)-binding domain-containing protein [Auriscalpium vulgare]